MTNSDLMSDIQLCIYRVRGQHIMIDSHLATLYQVKTKNLNKAVRRNIERFPIDFMFSLTHREHQALRFQFGTLKKGAHSKYSPLAFTEEGVAMLSGVLRSKKAVQVNIAIMRAFVKVRRALIANRDLNRRIEKLEGKVDMHDTDIRLLVQDVAKFKKGRLSGPINPSLL